MSYLDERSWLDILEKGIQSHLVLPKKDSDGLYGERFKGFSNLMKSTPLVIFSDNVMQSLAPAPLFTDGIRVYLHESLANECWKATQEGELEGFKTIWHGVMRSIEWTARTDGYGNASNQEWKYVEFVRLESLVNRLKSVGSVYWLNKIGFSMETTSKEIDKAIQEKKDVVSWILSKEPNKSNENKEEKPPTWFKEVDRIIHLRWETCETYWLNDVKENSYQRWVLKWLLAEKIGDLLGKARNALREEENEVYLKEGWEQALNGWVCVLKSMMLAHDWLSFERSVLSFMQTCQILEKLTIDEKTEIVGNAARILDERALKMEWVSVLSVSNEAHPLSQTLNENIVRFLSTRQQKDDYNGLEENESLAFEILAFYSLLPERFKDINFRKTYILSFFHDILEKLAIDEKTQEDILKDGFNLLLQLVRGIDADDALALIEEWRIWSEDHAPEWFENGDSFEENNDEEFKGYIEKMILELTTSRRWTQEQRQQIENIFF